MNFSTVEGSSSNYFFKYFDCFRIFQQRKYGVSAEFFQHVVKTALTFSRGEVRGIFFLSFLKEVKSFFFQPFRCSILVFFSKTRQNFLGNLVKAAFLSPPKNFFAKSFFSGKKLFHFTCSRIFERRKIGVMAKLFEQELKIAVFLPRWSFKVYFFLILII